MRAGISILTALLLVVLTPADVPAQPFERVLGPIVGPVNSLLRRGARKVFRPYMPRSRAVIRPASRQAVAQGAAPRAVRGQAAPKPFWPDAPQNIFDFVLSSKAAGVWQNGFGAIVVSGFTRADPAEEPAEARVASGGAGLTTGAGLTGTSDDLCSEPSASHADDVTRQLGAALGVGDDNPVLAELQSALQRTEDSMFAACPHTIPATLPERLRTMQDRLWAIRVAAAGLRSPLQKLDAELNEKQRAKLAAQPARSDGRDNQAGDTARQCAALSQSTPQWPAGEIASAVRPSKDQQAPLATLNETASQMGMLLMGACPQKMPATPGARLDATLDWLDAVLFAGLNTIVAVEDFYASLSEEQKTKLDRLEL